MKVLLYNKLTKEKREIEYPRQDLNPVLGDAIGNEYFFIEETSLPEDYNSIVHNIVPSIEFTEECLETSQHIKKAKKVYTIEARQDREISSTLDNSVGNWIEAHYPVWKQVKYISRYIYLSQLVSLGLATENINKEIRFLNDLDSWYNECRQLRDTKMKGWELDKEIPRLEWPKPPKKEDYEYN